MTKHFLLTGATGGIGSQLARHLAKSGHNLFLIARNEEKLKNLSEELNENNGINVKYKSVDLVDQKQRSAFHDELLATDISFDGIVLMPPQVPPSEDCLPDEAIWKEVFETSFLGPLQFIKQSLPFLKTNCRTKVVLISGISSAQVLPHYAMANFVRTAWLGQMKSMAFHYGPQKIHFNTLSLGGVLTEGYKEKLQKRADSNQKSFEDQMALETDNVPLQKYAAPSEVAYAIEALLSKATDHMTGQNILCDGGFFRGY